ncbi:RB1-inducible coiled-coil protein 1 isoform X2 [Plutella xylostella]|uniref:RB1-inducible coiled-coil protein 1 isoform X2 n=1 Tax=Plutella xylostella TaxID=51655 RepID=UPI00203275B4|nr:RB1-inducible coiled-coil protein 1 isoform X2 [Plutella xylostella]
MLYVFHVDAGLMTTYDMSLTLQSVSSLKAAIERKTKFPASSLVLLVSGGEVLQSDHMVSSYSAGTDTNPIYMFSKPTMKDSSMKQSNQYSVCDLSPIVELSTEQWRSDTRSGLEVKSVAELKSAVEMCCSLPPSVHTVVTCASLAQQFSELAHEISRCCEQLVHDQHLQHQGWSAVVANLDDIYHEFCERSKNFKESFKKHRMKKEQYHEQLDALNQVLESLGKIPILPALRMHAEAHRFSAFDVFEETEFDRQYQRSLEHSDDRGGEAFKLSEEDVFDTRKQLSDSQGGSAQQLDNRPIEDSDDGGVVFKARSYDSNKDEPTLLHWILAQGNKASLQDILDYCQKGLSLIDEEPLKEREAELRHILEYANMHGLKQLKGIEERLYGLEQLLSDVRALGRDQRDQAASLIQNRERVSTACDPSVLPTLVQSHRYQLEKLLKNHQVLFDIKRRIAKSKDELSHILRARLEAVLTIENSMSVQDAHQMLSFQCFGRLARYFDIVEQLQRAPAVFVRAVAEVARRVTFSTHFHQWATDLATHLLEIHNEEVSRRQSFNTLFHGHFLKTLFPGMTELPPPFATQTPPIFDSRVPKLTDEDWKFVSTAFPDLAAEVPQYDMEATIRFFRQRFAATDYEDKDVDVQADLDKGFDSENETGDFERLSRQSTTDKQRVDTSVTAVPDTMAVSTVTEDNMDSHKINMEKLKDFLLQLFQLCKANILFIREELARLKSDMDVQKQFIAGKYMEVLEAWQKSNEENALEFREQTQRLTVDHELELADLKNDLNGKDEVIASVKSDKEMLKQEHQHHIEELHKEHQSTKDLLEKVKEEIKSYEVKLEEAEAQKQKELKDLQDKMHQDYKAEIESLRSRFRLVALTNMDRSPSESSLEKIERTDVIEIANHNAIVMQTKENAEVEKEEAVREAVERVERDWQAKMEAELGALKTKYEVEKQVTINDVTRRLLSEKDRQLELLRERESNLVRECAKYKETIQQLTDPETNDYDSLLKPQLATLENEKAILQQQIQDLKSQLEKKSDDGDKSGKEEDSDGRSSSPKREERRRGRSISHTPYGLLGGTLSLSSCLPGHTVLLLWDPQHHNYTVMQEASIMYFVHSDCLPALELSINVKSESERRLYAVATVESKEYCYAKKSGNRYNMPRGFRFYRVRVKPYRAHPAPPPCCDHKHKPQDSQKSVDNSQSTSSADDSKCQYVATATLINLESPVSTSEPPTVQVEATEEEAPAPTVCPPRPPIDMECSVGRVLGPEIELPSELTVSAISVQSRTDTTVPADSELAEEATP